MQFSRSHSAVPTHHKESQGILRTVTLCGPMQAAAVHRAGDDDVPAVDGHQRRWGSTCGTPRSASAFKHCCLRPQPCSTATTLLSASQHRAHAQQRAASARAAWLTPNILPRIC